MQQSARGMVAAWTRELVMKVMPTVCMSFEGPDNRICWQRCKRKQKGTGEPTFSLSIWSNVVVLTDMERTEGRTGLLQETRNLVSDMLS